MLILVLVNVSVFEMIIYYFYPCFFPLDTSYSVYICPFVLSSALSLSIPKEQKCAPRKNNNMFNILHLKKNYSFVIQQLYINSQLVYQISLPDTI